jgi:hypothetical protein
VAVVRGQYHPESFECLRVLEGFEVAQPAEAESGQLTEVERGQGSGVE